MKLKTLLMVICCVVVSGLVVGGFITLDRHNHGNVRTIQALVNKDRDIIDVADALRITFDVSPPEAEAYAHIFLKWQSKGFVKWETLAGLTYVESRYNPTLTSPKGARGLLQLMPQMIDIYAVKRGIKPCPTIAWRDVLLLDMGCEMLYDLTKKWGYPKSLGIYNVGTDTFKISQAEFIMAVQKQEEKVSLVYEGLKTKRIGE